LSLLDQAIAHGGGKISAAGVGEMLGAIDQGFLLRLLESVAGGDAAAAVAVAADMQARSLSFDAALADLASLLLKLALAQSAPDALDADLPDRARVLELARGLDPETVQLCYQIALQGREDLPLAPDAHGGFVMTILRMLAFRPETARGEPAPVAKKPAGAKGDASWPQLVQSLAVTGAARELARNAELKRREGSLFELVVPKAKAFLVDRAHQEKLKAALEQHLGCAVTVKVSVGEVGGASAAAIEAGERDASRAAAAQAVQKDGFVNDLVNLLDGKVVGSSIRQEGK
jgi:DNA polymerase-3 subunit gamma/tau